MKSIRYENVMKLNMFSLENLNLFSRISIECNDGIDFSDCLEWMSLKLITIKLKDDLEKQRSLFLQANHFDWIYLRMKYLSWVWTRRICLILNIIERNQGKNEDIWRERELQVEVFRSDGAEADSEVNIRRMYLMKGEEFDLEWRWYVGGNI